MLSSDSSTPVESWPGPKGYEGRHLVELGWLLIARGRRLVERGELIIRTERDAAERRLARAAELLDKPTIGYYRRRLGRQENTP